MTTANYRQKAADLHEVAIRLLADDVFIEAQDGEEITIRYEAGTGIGKPDKLEIVQVGPRLEVRAGAGMPIPVFGRSGVAHVGIPQAWGRQLEITTASGDIGISGLSLHKARLKSASGDVRTSGCAVTGMDAASTSGEVRMEKHAGSWLAARSQSGDVVISATLEGEAALRTTSGDVVLVADVPAASCSSTSGDVRCSLGSPASFEGNSTSGDVKLRVAGMRNATRLDLSSTSGEVILAIPEGSAIDLSFSTVSGAMNTRRARGICLDCDGGVAVSMRTTSGGASIESFAAVEPKAAEQEGTDEDVHYI